MAAPRSFVPPGQTGLLLRSPINGGFAPVSYKTFSSDDSAQAVLETLGPREREILREESMPKRVGYYTRNNPHPGRVRHMKGLLDVPIRYVEDNYTNRELPSPPSGTDFGLPYRPPGNTRYSANRAKGIPAIGVVPVTTAWRDELERKTVGAIDRALGQPPPSRASIGSRGGQRSQQFGHVSDDTILELLCKILQTQSIPACKAWLANATTSEKNIVLNMIRMSAVGELEGVVTPPPPSRPQTQESQVRYMWRPSHRQELESWLTADPDSHLPYGQRDQMSVEEEFRTLSRSLKEPTNWNPEHPSIIQAARQIASSASQRPSSRGLRTRSMDLEEGGAIRLLNSRRGRPSSAQSRTHQDPLPPLSGQPQSGNQRQRSRSANLSRPTSVTGRDYPPPPVRVTISKESLRSGREGKQTPQLRYTSNWGEH